MSTGEWPTVTEAAHEMGVTTSYLRRMVRAGAIRGRLRGRTYLLDPASWRAFKMQRAKRLASAAGRADALRVAQLVDSGKMGTIGHDELVKLIAESQAHVAAVGD